MVFMGAGSIVLDSATGGALGTAGVGGAFGLSVFLAIFFFGKTSGAHINPAVTLASAVLGRFPYAAILPYWAAQLTGAVLASFMLVIIAGPASTIGATVPSGSAGESLLVETTISYILMFVIAMVTIAVKPSHTMTAFLVGGTVGLIATYAGPLSGASMNPARSFGPALAGGTFDSHWIYWIGPLAGTCLGAIAFRALNRNNTRKVN